MFPYILPGLLIWADHVERLPRHLFCLDRWLATHRDHRGFERLHRLVSGHHRLVSGHHRLPGEWTIHQTKSLIISLIVVSSRLTKMAYSSTLLEANFFIRARRQAKAKADQKALGILTIQELNKVWTSSVQCVGPHFLSTMSSERTVTSFHSAPLPPPLRLSIPRTPSCPPCPTS